MGSILHESDNATASRDFLYEFLALTSTPGADSYKLVLMGK